MQPIWEFVDIYINEKKTEYSCTILEIQEHRDKKTLLLFLKILENRVDIIESFINFLSHFCSSEDNLKESMAK